MRRRKNGQHDEGGYWRNKIVIAFKTRTVASSIIIYCTTAILQGDSSNKERKLQNVRNK